MFEMNSKGIASEYKRQFKTGAARGGVIQLLLVAFLVGGAIRLQRADARAAATSEGVQDGAKVTGRVAGLPMGLPAGTLDVALLAGPRQFAFLSAPVAVAAVASDGAFAFAEVAPGAYTLRLMGPGSLQLATDKALEVIDNRDVGGLTLLATPFVFGTVVVEGGGRLPVEASASGADDNDAAALTQIQAMSLGVVGGQRGAVRGDGAFVLATSNREQSVRVAELPFGYVVKSISFGATDLLQTPLKFEFNPAVTQPEFRVILAPRPSAPANVFSISGRVMGSLGSSSPVIVRLQAIRNTQAGAEPVEVAETLANKDGMFTFEKIPQGSYTLVAVSGSPWRSVSVQINDRDVSGIELAPRPAAVEVDSGKVRAALVQEQRFTDPLRAITGAGAVDCGFFYARYRPLRDVVVTDDVLRCSDSARKSGKSFAVVMATSGTDSTNVRGFAGEPGGTIHMFDYCMFGIGCGRVPFQSQACAANSTLADKRGALVCEPPPGFTIRWPSPVSPQ